MNLRHFVLYPSPTQQIKKSLRDKTQEKITDCHEKRTSNSKRMIQLYRKQRVGDTEMKRTIKAL